jgi:hypothetical protein
MSNIIPPTSASNLIVNDTQYEVVPRRRFERRAASELQAVNPEPATENKKMKVQKLDRKHTNLLRADERRQSVRRTSRPTLLSVNEIAALRKK